MPFAVMLYLMMTLAQLHGTQMLWRRAVSTGGHGGFAVARSLSDFGQALGQIADANKRILLVKDPSHYRLGNFVPP